ncbi:MAG TPA: winged helix-turn-helix domain-containing protein [Candidatus Dormibacteraeota bacterium]|nr:winged helix-turn-helix domain-containing protein [Candidatus Dormibacteraeota bacterium]
MLAHVPPSYEFGPYRLDPAQQLLTDGVRKIPLTPKAFQTLLVLVEARGRVVAKDEILQKVWPDAFVEEAVLSQNIFTLRKQLRDDGGDAVYIETVPKRGYRFAATVRLLELPNAVGEQASSTEVPTLSSPAQTSGPVLTRRRIVLVAVAVLFATLATLYSIRRTNPTLGSSGRVMLVVLPVQNLTGDPSQEYLADGLTEELIADVGSLNPQRLGVIARTSAMAYKQKSKTIQEIAKDLGVDYVLEASLREGSGHVRFTAQLIRAADQTHLWAHNYDRPMEDILALQGELARTVGEEIRIGLTQETVARLGSLRPVRPEAYDGYVRGRYHWNERTAGEVRTAIDYFQRAIAEDPGFAPAYASLADSYVLLTMMREAPPAEMMSKAKEAALKAQTLDPTLANAHTVLGEIDEVSGWDWAAAEKEFRRSVELDPNDSNAHHQYAIHFVVTGRFQQALEEIRRAQQVDPIAPVSFSSMGWIYLRAHRPELAIKECQKSLDLDSHYVRGHLCLGEAYEEQGKFKQAVEEFLVGKILSGAPQQQLAELKRGLQESGYGGYFRARLKQMQQQKSYVSPYDLADLSLRIGDREAALRWLDAAYAEHSPYLVFLRIEPRMDPLRSEPRFQNLIRRIGLADIQITSLTGE